MQDALRWSCAAPARRSFLSAILLDAQSNARTWMHSFAGIACPVTAGECSQQVTGQADRGSAGRSRSFYRFGNRAANQPVANVVRHGLQAAVADPRPGGR